MRNFSLHISHICLILLILLSPSSVIASPIPMIIFGDSLSDTGNMFSLSGGALPPSPPYAEKFSNGLNWVDQIAADYGLGAPNNVYSSGVLAGEIDNFAIGGAYTGPWPFDFSSLGTLPSRNSNDGLVGAPILPGLQGEVALPGAALSQVELFSLVSGGTAPSNARYTIWAGANDLIFAPEFSPAGTLASADVAASGVTNIRMTIEDLAAMGAEKFLVLNLPDLGSTPLGILSGREAELTAGTELFNIGLERMITEVSATLGIEITLLDIHTIFDNLLAAALADPAATGFPDVAALTSLGVPPGFAFCIDQRALTNFCAPGFEPNDRIFWDLLHPTARTYSLIADAVVRTEIPEPTTLVLIGLGLAGLGFTRQGRFKLGLWGLGGIRAQSHSETNAKPILL
ncbi:Lipolytic enzyme, G-D-S-L [Nitrosococcus oceani ATCC 19707]|uniref:Lipolytic enzyme, G-D-S-L n=2 Tax=Nitrosococcus oceani TaxID=1229 RepID=Q3J9H1_NITOC|nr:SGNH/GDSL hydrolase family protein [Nitrosococcus oceani]ABA58525.1 Lipolytic enzyme, G-D-S-L [Nitrosococcus oceani ATCC 19707]EDZ67964.1 GDSL-like lipase/acylhydrolase, putative [Nitrosococcus oceani AFC27]KFI19010.1 lipase [Nitrosococcus oceani C-27]GEM19645.1 lipase [Nitrosococcus oceani]